MADTFAEPTGNTEGIDADALLREIEGGGSANRPMQAQPEQTQQSQPAQQTPEEFEITWNGKQIKAPKEKALQWASQGYDYSQKMAELTRQRAEWETKQKEFEQSYTPYKTIDEYAKQNPEWWSHVEQSYQQKLANAQAAAPGQTSPEIEGLKAKLTEIEKFKTDLEAKEAAQKAEKEQQVLEGEIKSIRDTYKDLDWTSRDESGLDLEQRVLKHAIDNGIQSVRAAFRDYQHDHLLKLAAERAKESQTKDLQKRTKLGLLGQSQAPKKGLTPAEGVKTKSYEDLMREAKEEFGIA